ncbi:Zn-dependent peptidase ImmA, M78 family [Butyrivibrio sp. ob235]|uniref:ImmA/IrrE family metallo-endopeptidase n=1 Tax=Butyrivibrio sp. ob235 TaxID=1761780 RepID=UPI0008C42CEE|nr:ImmA/IrrE family metallo-endopeptidase [Butyrivibrio sp. ob235]SEM24781.1 Zn-dependent peptidase ImmA, M78 family [Butyrivibrio sp. ob235]
MNDTCKKNIRIHADAVRERCRISRYGIIDLFKECDEFGYKLIRYPIGENSSLGFAMSKEDDVVIFTNSSSRLSREIFTLAHEIGHVVLHFNSDKKFVDDSSTIFSSSEDDREQEANYFAACLLMPEDKIKKYIDLETNMNGQELTAMDIARIMSEFNVSFEMTLNRLESLGIIDIDQKICLDNTRNEMRVGNLLKSVGGNYKLNVATNEIVMPHEFIDYAIYNYNHNAIPKSTLEKTLSYYRLNIDDVEDRITERFQ